MNTLNISQKIVRDYSNRPEDQAKTFQFGLQKKKSPFTELKDRITPQSIEKQAQIQKQRQIYEQF